MFSAWILSIAYLAFPTLNLGILPMSKVNSNSIRVISLILGLLLGYGITEVVKIFQAKAHLESGIALESKTFTNLLAKASSSNQPKLEEKAIAEYREAIRIKPDFAPAYYYLADLLAKKGLKEEAIIRYQEAILIEPDFAPAHQKLGEILHEQGKSKEALAAYIQAIRHDPKFIDPHVQLAGLLEKQGRLDEAIAEYREALRLDPNHPFSGGYHHENIYAWLGQALKKDGRLAEAVEAYVSAIRIIPNCNFNTNNICELFYKDLESILKKQSDPGKPITESIKRIIHPKANKYLEIGTTYEKKNEQVAANYYTKAIHFDPKKAQSHVDLGNTLHTHNPSYTEEAITEYRQAIHLDHNNVEAHQQLGLILQSQSELDKAIAQYKELIRINPSDAFANKNIGIILYKQGKQKEAIPYLKVAINEYKRVNSQNTYSEEIKNIEDTLQAIGE